MTTVQLSKSLSVRQIAAIVKRLSRKDRDKLYDLIWDDLYEITDEHKKILDEKLRLFEEDPNRMIPFEEVKSLRLKV